MMSEDFFKYDVVFDYNIKADNPADPKKANEKSLT